MLERRIFKSPLLVCACSFGTSCFGFLHEIPVLTGSQGISGLRKNWFKPVWAPQGSSTLCRWVSITLVLCCRDHIEKKEGEKKKLKALMWVLPAAELCVSCFSSVFTFPALPFPCTIPVVFLTWFLHLWVLFVYILPVSVYIKAQWCDRYVWAEQEQTLLIHGVTFIAQAMCNPCWISFSSFLQE